MLRVIQMGNQRRLLEESRAQRPYGERPDRAKVQSTPLINIGKPRVERIIKHQVLVKQLLAFHILQQFYQAMLVYIINQPQEMIFI